MDLGVNQDDTEAIRRLETEAEEAYKRNALDYGQGYQAQKVREDNDVMALSSQPFFNQASKLFKEIVKSSQTTDNKAEAPAPALPPKVPQETKKPKEATSAAKAPAAAKAGQIDSDEEETVEMLQSEFQGSDPTPAESETKESKATPMDVDDDDIDDLAMAIASKKKKKKKSKK